MSGTVLRRGLLTQFFVAGLGAAAAAQSTARLRGFPSAEAAATALTDAVRANDGNAVAAILGESWVDFVLDDKADEGRERLAYLKAWDAKHMVRVADGTRATVEVGNETYVEYSPAFPLTVTEK